MLQLQFTPFPVLETERLVLRSIHESDDEDLFFLRTNEQVNKYLEGFRHSDIKQTQDLIANLKKGIESNEWIFWVITFKNSKKLIGTICLWNIDKENCRAETGYVMNPQYYGKGIMSDALKKVMEFGFEKMKLKTIGAYTHAANEKSIQLLAKNNFQYTGNKAETNEVSYSITWENFSVK